MKYKITRMLAMLLACVFTLNCVACKTTSGSLTDSVKASPVAEVENLEADMSGVADFYVRLFQNCVKEKADGNVLISPFSVIIALSMTANGAEDETLTQMEEVLGMDTESLNAWLHTYSTGLPESANANLYPANSIWFADRDSFTVNEEFLQINKDYYDAEIYKAPFDESTKDGINKWVNEKTEGMIPEILDEIPEDAVMYLVNALAFDARWQEVYEKKYVQPYGFHQEDGEKCLVDMMFSEEALYLQDEQATGFIKPYAGGKYAFAALLPDEEISVADYAASLNGERLMKIFSSTEEAQVWAGIPAFETEYDVEMSEVLKAMGMTDAFDSSLADLDSLGTSSKGNIYINRVLHRTFICVDEEGTKAAAATAVEAMEESGMWMPAEPKEVILDRPFVYMLIDTELNMPLFIGTMMSPEEGQ